MNPRPTHYECVALPLSYPGRSAEVTNRLMQRSSDFGVLSIIEHGPETLLDGLGLEGESGVHELLGADTHGPISK